MPLPGNRQSKKRPPAGVAFCGTILRRLAPSALCSGGVFLFLKPESIRLTHAIEHVVYRNRNAPIIQRGLITGPALEPARDVRRRPCATRTSHALIIRGGIRTIHVHSTSTGSVSFAIPTIPRKRGFDICHI